MYRRCLVNCIVGVKLPSGCPGTGTAFATLYHVPVQIALLHFTNEYIIYPRIFHEGKVDCRYCQIVNGPIIS